MTDTTLPITAIDLRDYFASKAMAGLLGRDLELTSDPDKYVLAEHAYEIADAMLKVGLEARK